MHSCSYQAGGVLARSAGTERGQKEDVGSSDNQEVTITAWWLWGGLWVVGHSVLMVSGQ